MPKKAKYIFADNVDANKAMLDEVFTDAFAMVNDIVQKINNKENWGKPVLPANKDFFLLTNSLGNGYYTKTIPANISCGEDVLNKAFIPPENSITELLFPDNFELEVQDQTLSSAKIQDFSLKGTFFADKSITTEFLAPYAINSFHFKPDVVTENIIQKQTLQPKNFDYDSFSKININFDRNSRHVVCTYYAVDKQQPVQLVFDTVFPPGFQDKKIVYSYVIEGKITLKINEDTNPMLLQRLPGSLLFFLDKFPVLEIEGHVLTFGDLSQNSIFRENEKAIEFVFFYEGEEEAQQTDTNPLKAVVMLDFYKYYLQEVTETITQDAEKKEISTITFTTSNTVFLIDFVFSHTTLQTKENEKVTVVQTKGVLPSFGTFTETVSTQGGRRFAETTNTTSVGDNNLLVKTQTLENPQFIKKKIFAKVPEKYQYQQQHTEIAGVNYDEFLGFESIVDAKEGSKVLLFKNQNGVLYTVLSKQEKSVEETIQQLDKGILQFEKTKLTDTVEKGAYFTVGGKEIPLKRTITKKEENVYTVVVETTDESEGFKISTTYDINNGVIEEQGALYKKDEEEEIIYTSTTNNYISKNQVVKKDLNTSKSGDLLNILDKTQALVDKDKTFFQGKKVQEIRPSISYDIANKIKTGGLKICESTQTDDFFINTKSTELKHGKREEVTIEGNRLRFDKVEQDDHQFFSYNGKSKNKQDFIEKNEQTVQIFAMNQPIQTKTNIMYSLSSDVASIKYEGEPLATYEKKIRAEIQTIEGEKQEILHKKIQDIQVELTAALEAKQRLENIVEEKTTQIVEQEERNNIMVNSFNVLKNTNEELKKHVQELEAENLQGQEKIQKMEEIEASRQKLVNDLQDAINKCNTIISDKEQKYITVVNELNSIKVESAQTKKSREQHEKEMTQKIKQMTKKVKNKEKELENSVRTVQEKDKQIQDLQERTLNFQKQAQKLATDLESAKQAKIALQESLNVASLTTENLIADKKRLEKEIKSIKKVSENNIQQFKEASAELKKNRKILASKERELQTISEERRKLFNDLQRISQNDTIFPTSIFASTSTDASLKKELLGILQEMVKKVALVLEGFDSFEKAGRQLQFKNNIYRYKFIGTPYGFKLRSNDDEEIDNAMKDANDLISEMSYFVIFLYKFILSKDTLANIDGAKRRAEVLRKKYEYEFSLRTEAPYRIRNIFSKILTGVDDTNILGVGTNLRQKTIQQIREEPKIEVPLSQSQQIKPSNFNVFFQPVVFQFSFLQRLQPYWEIPLNRIFPVKLSFSWGKSIDIDVSRVLPHNLYRSVSPIIQGIDSKSLPSGQYGDYILKLYKKDRWENISLQRGTAELVSHQVVEIKQKTGITNEVGIRSTYENREQYFPSKEVYGRTRSFFWKESLFTNPDISNFPPLQDAKYELLVQRVIGGNYANMDTFSGRIWFEGAPPFRGILLFDGYDSRGEKYLVYTNLYYNANNRVLEPQIERDSHKNMTYGVKGQIIFTKKSFDNELLYEIKNVSGNPFSPTRTVSITFYKDPATFVQ